MKTLPNIYTYTGSNRVQHPEDPNLKDVNHLAETIRKICNLNVDDLPPDKHLSKEQVVGIVELVENELLSHPAMRPVKHDILITDPHAIRVKDETQLIEELDNLGEQVLKKYPQIATTIEEATMKSLFMWHGCLNIDKECRLKDVHGTKSEARMQVHNWLANQSTLNPWIGTDFTSARCFRQTPDQKKLKDYSWIPSDSPYWQ